MRGGGHKEEDHICRWVAKATGFFEAATGKFLESRAYCPKCPVGITVVFYRAVQWCD